MSCEAACLGQKIWLYFQHSTMSESLILLDGACFILICHLGVERSPRNFKQCAFQYWISQCFQWWLLSVSSPYSVNRACVRLSDLPCPLWRGGKGDTFLLGKPESQGKPLPGEHAFSSVRVPSSHSLTESTYRSSWRYHRGVSFEKQYMHFEEFQYSTENTMPLQYISWGLGEEQLAMHTRNTMTEDTTEQRQMRALQWEWQWQKQ